MIAFNSKKELANCLSELALAIATQPVGYDGEDFFDRGDDTVLLGLGFRSIDSTHMVGELFGITWYVNLEAKRTPLWSYMVHGVHRSPVRFGRMNYNDVANGLHEINDRLIAHAKRRTQK